jgi:hypothetical protein
VGQRRIVFVTGGTGYIGSLDPPALVCRRSGPHYWPILFSPACGLLERIPGTRDTTRRLGLVTIAQMLEALVDAVEHPAIGPRVLDVPALRRLHSG